LAVERDTLEQTPEFGQKELEISRRTALTTVAKLGLGSAALSRQVTSRMP
jgi:hypothetical protein